MRNKRNQRIHNNSNVSTIFGLQKTNNARNEKNVAILGDNLYALTALQADKSLARHTRDLKIIYIDPPYNVGGNFGYKNSWRGATHDKYAWAREHGAFLEFLEPRLQQARKLLNEDGIIFISICDQEYSHLKILMDDVFGVENCLGTVIWDKAQGANGKHMTTIHEYVLVYAKNAKIAPQLITAKPAAEMMLNKAKELFEAKIPYSEAQSIFRKWVTDAEKNGLISSGESPYKNLHPDTFRPFQATPSCAHDNPDRRSHRKLKHPLTQKFCKVPAKGWKWSDKKIDEMLKGKTLAIGDQFVVCGQFVFGKNEQTVPRKLQYLDEKMGKALPSILAVSYGGQKDLPRGVQFSTPKPVKLMKELIRAYPEKHCTIMDFFAGSGSTAQAVEELNEEDGGKRGWIVVECMETTFNSVLIPRLRGLSIKNYSTFKVISQSKEIEAAIFDRLAG